MKINFWGVRGSIPSPGPNTIKYGGNTSCIEVKITDQYSVVIDAGSGLRLLGNSLLSKMPIQMSIFVTHTHWDHIQGFPFFVPAFIMGNSVNFFGAKKVNYDLEATLRGQQEYNNFPVELHDMKSSIIFSEVEEGQKVYISLYIKSDSDGESVTDNLVDVKYSFTNPFEKQYDESGCVVVARKPDELVVVSTAKLNHPYPGVFGYRIEHNDKAVVVATDTEHYSSLHPPLTNLAMDADYLIYDCQYSEDQYQRGMNNGWGHSTPKEGLRACKAANVKNMVMFHYDPNTSDEAVDEMLSQTKEYASNMEGCNTNVIASYEGLEIEV